MDAEFHYHITWLIAARAGLPPEDVEILSTASQYTDDNDIIFEIDKDRPTAYRNYISQTMNILKPKARLIRIYPIFHFIPGDPMAESPWRRDGTCMRDLAVMRNRLLKLWLNLRRYAMWKSRMWLWWWVM